MKDFMASHIHLRPLAHAVILGVMGLSGCTASAPLDQWQHPSTVYEDGGEWPENSDMIGNRILVEQIRRSPDYRHATGCADDPETAREAALSALVQSVRVHVIARTRSQVEEQGDSLDSVFDRTIQTASAMSIHGLRSESWRDGARYCAIAYVHTDSLMAGYERSRGQMFTLIRDAHNAREAGRLGDALRSLFWAYLLAGSLPDPREVEVSGTNLTEPLSALLAGMRSITEGLTIRADRPAREGTLISVALHAEFEGGPVEQLDFRYYRGHGQEFGSFRRGRPEIIELDTEITNPVLNLMHVYRGDLVRNPDLLAAYQTMGEPELDLYVTVPVSYPWKESPRSEPGGAGPPRVPPLERPTDLPPAMHGLLACDDGASFAHALDVYRRNDRLVVGRSHHDVQRPDLQVFLAVVDPDDNQVRPIVLSPTEDGYLDLRSQVRHQDLREFRGRRLIYIGVPRRP